MAFEKQQHHHWERSIGLNGDQDSMIRKCLQVLGPKKEKRLHV